MSCFLGCVRIVLALLNLLLFIAFAAIGVLGFLLKYNTQFLYNLLEKATTKWPQKEMHDVVKFIQTNGSGLAIGFIVLGVVVAVIALIGLFALFCKIRFLGIIYLALLTILSLVELGLIIYLFAIPGNLEKATFKLLDKSFEHLRTNDSLTEATHSLWKMLGSDGNKPCCGLDGYQDFHGMLPTLQLPSSCCTKDDKKCNETIAKMDKVEGCKGKVTKFLDKNKVYFIGFGCGVLVFQIVILIVVCVVLKKKKEEY